jgi:MoxR-like ATPase
MKNQTYEGGGEIPLSDGKKIKYSASEQLKEAINLALLINRPLLLMGEPGVGKTLAAKAVAHEWYGDNIEGHYFQWNIKSTTKAQEGLYRYDALRRLSDAQILKAEDREKLNNTTLGAEDSYFQYGKLSEAIKKSTKSDRSILLIDEIDKAEIDFPNDLLHELENYEFTIPETNENVKKPEGFEFPLIIITSNREKELPPAFLRRCIYFYIDFPNENELEAILCNHFIEDKNQNVGQIKKAVSEFVKLRTIIDKYLMGLDKKLSTSELVDWYGVINKLQNTKNIDEQHKKLLSQVEKWFNEEGEKQIKDIPFYQVLFKNIETTKLIANLKQ